MSPEVIKLTEIGYFPGIVGLFTVLIFKTLEAQNKIIHLIPELEIAAN